MAIDTSGTTVGERAASGASATAPQAEQPKLGGTTATTAGNPKDAQTALSSEERRRKITEAAYYCAERRGFAPGHEEADWLYAEKEIDMEQDRPLGNHEIAVDVDELNKCLRSELSAIETYQQALEKSGSLYPKDPKLQQLSQILADHQQAASALRALIQQKGGTPSIDSGAWGTWSKTIMGAAKLLGDKTALRALSEGEESGMKEYQSIAERAGAPADVKSVTSPLLAKQQEHIRQLENFIEGA